MIITRTPYRISFFGGGTDYPAWYRDHGGCVLSTTIDKYCYVNCRYLPPFFDINYLIRYSMREETQTIQEIRHPAVRECLNHLNFQKGIEMVHTGDLPARSGIGSSSSFTVGFLNALYSLVGKMTTKRQLAGDAIHIEQNLIAENVGSQDQVAVAFGGLNKIEFGGERVFYVYPVTIDQEKIRSFQDHLLLFFTGFARNASDIAKEQIRRTAQNKNELRAMSEMVDQALAILNGDVKHILDFGKLLHEAWLLKKSLSNMITTARIDNLYETARHAGATGGKLLGAGGGGFILFFVPPEKQKNVKTALKGILHVPFRFENLGTQVVLYST
jgi:D-glycero-alpha-D-manno-heptose-7-phosphate kinase